MTFVIVLLLLSCLPTCSHSKHLLRYVTICQKDVPSDGQTDVEFDSDELVYIDPVTHESIQRLPEFSEQWIPDRGLAEDAYLVLRTCKYNIPRAAKGEKYPPEAKAIPTSLIYAKEEMEFGVPNMLMCFVNNFHPPTINITWTRNGEHVDKSNVNQTYFYSNKDFSFRITSYLDFIPQEGDIYSCTVEHSSLQEPLTRLWEVEVYTEQQAAETALCACGVIVGLAGVGVGIWFIVKVNKLPSHL